MKDDSGVCSKLELIEAISKSLQLPCGSRKRLGDGEGLERQQEELKVGNAVHFCTA